MKLNSSEVIFSSSSARVGVLLASLLLTTYYFLFSIPPVFAQSESLAITIMPPLFQVTIAPGTEWKSSIKVVNTNHYPLSVYARAVNFHPSGETGNPVFDDIFGNSDTPLSGLASWITVPGGDITIPADKTGEVPLAITVPEDANPGGHYAAILVGTRPPDKVEGGGAAIGSLLSSLVLLRVPGEIVEMGGIRDFYTESTLTERPDQVFTLRFENRGNVHLVPQGQIVITNMWGKERGKLIVNEKNTFGNILPGSTRKFAFEWKSEPSVFDIGLYKAEAILSFGELAKQSDTRTTYFWIVPWKPVSGLLLGIIAFFWFMSWALRRYVARALELERARYGLRHPAEHDARGGHKEHHGGRGHTATQTHKHQPELTFSALKRPIIEGALDISGKRTMPLGHHAPEAGAHHVRRERLGTRIKRYRMFFVTAAVFVVGVSMVGWYFVEVFEEERKFDVHEIRE